MQFTDQAITTTSSGSGPLRGGEGGVSQRPGPVGGPGRATPNDGPHEVDRQGLSGMQLCYCTTILLKV